MNIALVLIFFNSSLLAAEPDWVTNYGKSIKFPVELYITGFATASAKEKDAEKLAEDNARANLARNLMVNIKSYIVDKLTEINSRSVQSYQSITESSSNIELLGVSSELFKKDKLVYAFAYVSRADLISMYKKKKIGITQQIISLIKQAEIDEKEGKTDAAADKYYKTFPLYDNLDQADCILFVAEPKRNFTESVSLVQVSREEIALRADKLLAQSVNSVNDAARALAYQMSKQVASSDQTLMIVPFSFQDSKMSSSFARFFQSVLEQQISKFRIGKVVHQSADASPRSISITRDIAVQSGAAFILDGNYWILGQTIRIMGRLKNTQNGQILASAETDLDTVHIIRQGLLYLPENFVKLLADQKAFSEDEIISGGIQLDVWTNKGNENLLFVEDDIMKVYIRVNRPAHIRILYNTADGQHALLLNDYYIDETKANMVVELPQEFQCAPPFGSEMMFVVARTEPFPELKTIVEGGYEFIVNENSGQLAAGVRGMIKAKKSDMGFQQTETRIILTTVAK